MPEISLNEKVSVNINSSTLSYIDLLVDNGYYSNRSDFINHAVRQALEQKQSIVERIVQNKSENKSDSNDWFIGVYCPEREYLERKKSNGEKIRISGYGVLILKKEYPDELITQTIENINIRGSIRCSEGLKKHYGLK